MTAENASPDRRGGSFAPRAAAALLIFTALAAVGGWLHTVRELNRLTAYQVVGAEALRQLRAAHAGKTAIPEIGAKR
jgi:hypothetical protein